MCKSFTYKFPVCISSNGYWYVFVYNGSITNFAKIIYTPCPKGAIGFDAETGSITGKNFLPALAIGYSGN